MRLTTLWLLSASLLLGANAIAADTAKQWHSVKLLPEPEKNSIAFWDA